MSSGERRSDLRGTMTFRVKFKILSREEYEKSKKIKASRISGNETAPPSPDLPESSSQDYMMRFLIKMDEKLDRILRILSRESENGDPWEEGMGVNISGSGMKLVSRRAVECGRIVQTHFVLSSTPPVFLDVYGEVIRVTPVQDKGRKAYHLGVAFLDCDMGDRDRIISCIFQRQREEIRKLKTHGGPLEVR